MNTSNKRLKISASFPGFYLTFLTPRLARLSLLTPCLTLARASQQILAFSTLRTESLTHPGCELPSPVRWRRVPPGHPTLPFQLYLSVFTCPTASLHLPSDAGESLPARQPYLFHPTADLPFRFYLSDTASLDLPSDAGESLPARQLYLFEPVAQRGSPVRHGDLETSRTSTRASQTTTSPFLARRGLPAWHSDSKTSRTSARAYRSVKFIFSILRPAKAYPTTLPVDCKAFRPLNFTLPSNPVQLGEPRSLPLDAGESTPGQTIFSFQVHARRG